MANTYALQSASYDPTFTAYKRGAFAQAIVTFVGGVTVPAVGTVATPQQIARTAPGFTIARTGVGTFTGTAPLAARGMFMTQMLTASQAAPSGQYVTVTSYSPTLGTFAFTVRQSSTGLPVDIVTTTDEIWLLFLLEGG